MSTISPLPTAPSRANPANFAVLADAWVAALAAFTTETNTVAGEVNTNATTASTAASTATTQASNAAASAASAINAPGTSATSTTSLTVSVGSKSLTLAQTGKAFALGQQVVIADTVTPTNRMFGGITAFNSGTGAMTVLVSGVEGSGTLSAWTISLGVASVAPSLPASLIRDARTSNILLIQTDKGKLIEYTSGTFTQTVDTAANLGNGWWIELYNSGTGVVTWGTLAIYKGQRYRLQSDGTTIRVTALSDQGLLIVREERPSGTSAGNATGTTWDTRVLNTVKVNTISGASLGSNLITLPAGTYYFRAWAVGFSLSASINNHQCRLYNVTGSVALSAGSSQTSAAGVSTKSEVTDLLTFASTTTIRLEHYFLSAVGDGMGKASGQGVEVYSTVEVRKVY